MCVDDDVMAVQDLTAREVTLSERGVRWRGVVCVWGTGGETRWWGVVVKLSKERW